MIISKTNTKGIDTVINSLQNELYLNLLNNWLAGSDYEMYPRANKLLVDNELLPVVSTDEKDYNLTLFDDRFSATSFFYPDNEKVYSPSGGGITQRLHLVFQVNLKELYDSNERLDEVFNTEVLQLINRYLSYVTEADVEVTEGVEEVYSAFRLNNQTKINIMASDTSHFHVVRFSFDVFYDIGCAESTVSSCFPVTINVNGELMTVAASGDTANITIKDTLGVTQGDRVGASFEYIVPAGLTVVRNYVRPKPSGLVEAKADYDTGWRIENNIDSYRPSAIGQYLIIDPQRNWRLLSTNVFLHTFNWTGLTGGYYDPDTGLYYDVNGVERSRVEAFPDSIILNHHTGQPWQLDALSTQAGWETQLTNAFDHTQGGLSNWWIPSRTELSSMGTYEVFAPFNASNIPLNWLPVNKWTSDEYGLSSTQAWYVSTVGQILATSKGNAWRAVFCDVGFNPNTDL